MEHKWIKNYIKGKYAIIECSCGKVIKGFNTDGAEKYFFLHQKAEQTQKGMKYDNSNKNK